MRVTSGAWPAGKKIVRVTAGTVIFRETNLVIRVGNLHNSLRTDVINTVPTVYLLGAVLAHL